MATYTFGESTSSTSSSIKNNWYRSYSISSINSSVRSNIPKYSTITEAKFYFEGYQTIGLGSTKADGIIRIGSDHKDDTYGIAGSTGNLTKGNWTPVYANDLNCVNTSGANAGEIKSNYSSLSLHYLCRADIARTLGLRNTYIYYTYNPPTYTISLKVNNANWGTVSGGGTWNITMSNFTKTVVATPKPGYKFIKWQEDGYNKNEKTITISQNSISSNSTTLTLTAVFEPIDYEVVLSCEGIFNAAEPTLSGGGFFKYGDTFTLKAENIPDYHIFKEWFISAGTTLSFYSNPVTITINEKFKPSDGYTSYYTSAICIFEFLGYTIKANITDKNSGTVDYGYQTDSYYVKGKISNDGVLLKNTDTIDINQLYIRAVPNNGYDFIQWSDGITDNPRKANLTGDTIFTPIFEKTQCIVYYRNDDETIISSKTIKYGDTLGNLPTISKNEYEFVGWIPCAPARKTDNSILESCYYDGKTAYPLLTKYKYTDSLAIHIEVYMDDWKQIIDKQIMSCTESGGWGFGYLANTPVNGVESHGFEVHGGDGYGYFGYDLQFGVEKEVYQNKKWYSFDIVVANETIEIFVNNISKGQNPTGQYIKYNSSNTIFVGGESLKNLEDATNYFNGYISNIFIANQDIKLEIANENTLVTKDIDYYPVWRTNTKINNIYTGTSQPKDIYVGNQKVKEVYIGNTKIYG